MKQTIKYKNNIAIQ